MHNISPTSPVLGDPLQLFPAQPRLRDVCLKVTPPGVFRSPSLSLALGVPRQGLYCNAGVWLSQCVAKPSPSSVDVYLYLNLTCPLPEVLVADFTGRPDWSSFSKEYAGGGMGKWPPYTLKKMLIMMRCIFIRGR